MKRMLSAVYLLAVICATLFLYMNKSIDIPVSEQLEQQENVLAVSGGSVTSSALSGALLLQAARTVDYMNAAVLPKPEGFDLLEDNLRLSEAADLVRQSSWPFDEMPSDVPAYIQGTVRSYGASAQGLYAVIESDTSALEAYREMLRLEQYTLSADGSTARKGERQIKLWHDGKTSLYLSVSQLAYDNLWPFEETPDFLTPVPDKKMAYRPEITAQGESLYSMRAQFGEMDEAQAQRYLESLAQGLDNAKLDSLSVSGETTWNGRDWWVYAELYKQEDDSAVFSYGWGIRNKE